jgi:hypothetical protein
MEDVMDRIFVKEQVSVRILPKAARRPLDYDF